MGRMKRIFWIARLTAVEGLRHGNYFFITFFTVALTALIPYLAFFNLGERAKAIADLGLSTMPVAGTLLVALTAGTAIAEDLEGRTALTMLAKPVGRGDFLIGKFMGTVVVAVAFIIVASLVLLTVLRFQTEPENSAFGDSVLVAAIVFLLVFTSAMLVYLFGNRGWGAVGSFWTAFAAGGVVLFSISDSTQWSWRILAGPLCVIMQLLILTAFAVLFSVRFSVVQTVLGVIAVFFVGQASSALLRPIATSVPGRLLRVVVPDLNVFNLSDALATGYLQPPAVIPWNVPLGLTLYAVLYGGAVLILANLLFAHRDLG